MFITEYDEQKAFAETKAEGWREGNAEGRAEGIAIGETKGRAEGVQEGQVIGAVKTLISLVKKGFLPISQAAEEAQMSVPEFEAKMNAN